MTHKKRVYTGRIFDYKDFNVLDLNLFGGPHRGWLKTEEWIDVMDYEGVLMEVVTALAGSDEEGA